MTAGFEVNEPRAIAYAVFEAAVRAADKAKQDAYDAAWAAFSATLSQARDDEPDNDHDER